MEQIGMELQRWVLVCHDHDSRTHALGKEKPEPIFFFFFFFLRFRAIPTVYGVSQARGPIRAAAAVLHHSHSNAGSLTH